MATLSKSPLMTLWAEANPASNSASKIESSAIRIMRTFCTKTSCVRQTKNKALLREEPAKTVTPGRGKCESTRRKRTTCGRSRPQKPSRRVEESVKVYAEGDHMPTIATIHAAASRSRNTGGSRLRKLVPPVLTCAGPVFKCAGPSDRRGPSVRSCSMPR